MSVKRRKFIRTVSYLLAVSVVIAATGYFSFRAKASYEATLERVRFDGLSSLCEYMHEISLGLNLLSVSAGESVEDSAAYVGARALGARGSAACFEPVRLENINRFIEYVYDFSQSFSGGDGERKKAAELSDYAEEVYYHLSDLSVAVMNGEYRLNEFGSIYRRSEKPFFEDYIDYSNGNEKSLFAVEASAKLSFAGGETLTVEQAREKAEKLTGVDSVLWRERESNEIIYSLFHGNTAVEICRQGGAIMRFINPLPCAERVLNEADALKKATDFAEKCGCRNLKAVTAEMQTFTARFVLAPEVNGVLLLTSTVSVGVCLASGGITYFDAENYIKNFRTDIYDAEIPDISSILPSNVYLEKTVLCLAEIGGRERLCILALCGYADGKVQIYIDYNSYKIIKTAVEGGF